MSDQLTASLLGNRYHLEHLLGRGGMALVYRGYDTTLERPVAIKILRHDYSQKTGFQERFKQEAKSVANLTHPNIITVYDFGIDRGRLFIVLELINGSDLKQLIHNKGIFDVNEAINIITQACDGVGYAHRTGIVHCDIKPQNMLITSDMRLKVGDFGIARVLANIQPEEKNTVVWGSPQYFSPEQAGGLAPSPASDVYSLGVILFELLTGRLPFESKNSEELSNMHQYSLPPTPSKINPRIPAELDRIILKVLSKEPNSRYRTADQFGRILSNWENIEKGDFDSSSPAGITIQSPASDISQTIVSRVNPPPSAPIHTPIQNTAKPGTARPDVGTTLLGFMAFLMAGGLIPFWMYVILQLITFK